MVAGILAAHDGPETLLQFRDEALKVPFLRFVSCFDFVTCTVSF